jgi:hypothetical protein
MRSKRCMLPILVHSARRCMVKEGR